MKAPMVAFLVTLALVLGAGVAVVQGWSVAGVLLLIIGVGLLISAITWIVVDSFRFLALIVGTVACLWGWSILF